MSEDHEFLLFGSQDLVASGEVEVVNLNEDYKPIRFSKDVVSCLSQFREGHDITVVG